MFLIYFHIVRTDCNKINCYSVILNITEEFYDTHIQTSVKLLKLLNES